MTHASLMLRIGFASGFQAVESGATKHVKNSDREMKAARVSAIRKHKLVRRRLWFET